MFCFTFGISIYYLNSTDSEDKTQKNSLLVMYGIKINILRFHARVNSIYLLEDNYFLAINISKPTSVSMKMLFHSPNREFSVINSREPLKLSFVNWSSMTFTQFNVFDTTRHMNHLSLQFVPPPSPLSYRRHLWLRFIQKVKSLETLI